MAQLQKRNDELVVNSQVSELKMEVKEKEFRIKEIEKEFLLRQKELLHDIEKLQSEVKAKELENQRLVADKEKEMKAIRDRGVMSKRYMENIQKEQRIMSGVFHKMGMDLYN